MRNTYAVPYEVRALALLRMDAEYGEGSFEGLEARGLSGVEPMADRICRKGLAQAESDLRDVLKALPLLGLPKGSSDWMYAMQGGFPYDERRFYPDLVGAPVPSPVEA